MPTGPDSAFAPSNEQGSAWCGSIAEPRSRFEPAQMVWLSAIAKRPAVAGACKVLLPPQAGCQRGYIVWIPPGVKHWHGATATNAVTHIAVQEHIGGKVVDWMEQVSDEEYRS